MRLFSVSKLINCAFIVILDEKILQRKFDIQISLQNYPPPPTPVEAPQFQASISHSRQAPSQQFSLPRPVAAATANPREVPVYDIDDCRPTNQIQPQRYVCQNSVFEALS